MKKLILLSTFIIACYLVNAQTPASGTVKSSNSQELLQKSAGTKSSIQNIKKVKQSEAQKKRMIKKPDEGGVGGAGNKVNEGGGSGAGNGIQPDKEGPGGGGTGKNGGKGTVKGSSKEGPGGGGSGKTR